MTQPALSTPTPPLAMAVQEGDAIIDAHVTDEEAVTALILAERQAAIDHNLALLGRLWAADAHIVDGRGTTSTSDDYRWQGHVAILDRYQVAVFPFYLPSLPALDPAASIVIIGDVATVQHDNDEWRLVKIDQRWWLSVLEYNLHPSK